MKTTIAYKGFDKTLKCRNFQYKIGETYTEDKAEICQSGFHACTNPLDIWSYYAPIDGARFAQVELIGETFSEKGKDSKICAKTIKIIKELTIKELIDLAVKMNPNASSGDYAKNGSSGNYATNASSGYYATNASSGYSANNASSGYSAKNASSGNNAKNASSGDFAKNASSGDSASNASSGYSANNASSGDYASNEALGKNSVIACAGNGSKAKGVKGTWFALPKYNKEGICTGFITGCFGENDIKENTWYTVKDEVLIES